MWHEIYREALENALKITRKNNPRISSRSFGRKLGLSASEISELLKGKRRLSKKRALEIAGKLPLTAREIKNLQAQINPDHQTMRSLPEIANEIFDNWHFLAILQYFDTDDCDKSVETIARRLAIPLESVIECVDSLCLWGLLVRNINDKIERSDCKFGEIDGMGTSFKKSFFQLTQKKIEQQEHPAKEISSMIFPANPKNLEAAHNVIQSTFQEVEISLSSSPRKDLYQMVVFLFPITEMEE